jgi:hypothetical protein
MANSIRACKIKAWPYITGFFGVLISDFWLKIVLGGYNRDLYMSSPKVVLAFFLFTLPFHT